MRVEPGQHWVSIAGPQELTVRAKSPLLVGWWVVVPGDSTRPMTIDEPTLLSDYLLVPSEQPTALAG